MGDKNADQLLVERVQRGDKQAFDILVKKYQNRVVKLISRYVFDSEEVLDVAQEAFIKAYRAIPGFRGESAFYTWLYRIAINAAKNHLVAKGRRPPGTDVDVEEAEFLQGDTELKETGTPEGLLRRDQIQHAVARAIDRLPDDLRKAITLRELDGLSYEEIAEKMQCPVGTVRSRIFRAREAIQHELEPYLD